MILFAFSKQYLPIFVKSIKLFVESQILKHFKFNQSLKKYFRLKFKLKKEPKDELNNT